MNNTTRICAFLGTLSYITAPAAFTADKVYAVVFDVALNPYGQLAALTVNRVIDPASGTIDPVPVSVPSSAVADARAFLAARAFTAETSRFSSYSFFGA
jgi:hypothetical protein